MHGHEEHGMAMTRRAGGMGAAAALSGPAGAPTRAGETPRAVPGMLDAEVSAEAREFAAWVLRRRDHGGLPFAVVDKRDARLMVFSPRGRLVGATPALLGASRGDHAVPGVGDLPPAQIPPDARTTPAGRFVSEPGRNLDGEDVVWFDYDAGLAIHRLRANAALGARLQRLGSGDPAAHRVSAGCVVVPVAFYESVVQPWL